MIESTVMVVDMFQREDLHVVGLVYARRRRTVTMWCSPKNDPPERYLREQPAAMIFVMSDGISVVLHPEWTSQSWFTQYIDQLTREIASAGENGLVSM